jgi:hypothetical protein
VKNTTGFVEEGRVNLFFFPVDNVEGRQDEAFYNYTSFSCTKGCKGLVLPSFGIVHREEEQIDSPLLDNRYSLT